MKRLVFAALLLAASPAHAGNIVGALPFQLTNGNVADATQVISNFNDIVTDVNANAAHNGGNSDITSLTGLSTPLSVSQGGSGAATFTLNSLLLGNGAAAVQAGPVPGTTGNLVMSNGTTWTSATTLTGSYNLGVNATVPASAGLHSTASNILDLSTNGADRVIVGVGVQIGSPGGGDKGSGTLNLGGVFVQGNSLGDGSALAAASGFVDLPGGIIMQWGTFTSNGSVGSVTPSFAKPFPSNVFSIQCTVQNQQTMGINCSNNNLSSFSSIGTVGGNPSVYYIAIGN